MKKLLLIALSLLLLCSLSACGKGGNEEPEPQVGGWQKVENGVITPELQEMFDKAMQGLDGVNYVPLELLETQVVAGMKYRFRCESTVVYPGAQAKEAIVTIYKDPQGNLEVTNIETDEEPTDPTIDIPTYTEDMFDMTFDFYDTINFDAVGKEDLGIANIYGLWQGVVAKNTGDDSVDRELCFINIYERDGKMVMEVTPKLRDEGEHVYDTNHQLGIFERSEGNNPTFVNGGMIIKLEQLLTDGEHQYAVGGMEIPEINESSTLTMYR